MDIKDFVNNYFYSNQLKMIHSKFNSLKKPFDF